MKIASRDLSSHDWRDIDAGHFARLFGTTAGALPPDCLEMIRTGDFAYRELPRQERDRIVLEVCKKIDSPTLTVAGSEGKERWERGWAENLREFVASGCDLAALVPKFVRPNQPIRFENDYVMPRNPQFELDCYRVFRRWLFRTFLADAPVIYEFGCGTGYNLAELAELYPRTELHGLDWVSAPKEIIRLLAERRGYRMTGHVFDMLAPDRSLALPAGATILAIGALEQIGTQWEPFLQFILDRKPALFVHVDSILEWYDEGSLTDYLAAKFDRRRKYLEGYWPRLQQLEVEGRIEILQTQRSPFGSLFHDGYSLIVWRPRV
jgi:hypothetical protein